MVLVTSRMGLLTAAPSRLAVLDGSPTGAPLLPKVRGQFAEFLDQGSLVRFGLLDLPTGVGVRYGQCFAPAMAFRACSGADALPRPLRGAARPRLSAHRPTGLNGPRLAARHAPQGPWSSLLTLVLESQPAVHRLRVSASA